MRAKPNMSFLWPGYERRRLGASSLLFKREVIDELGYFDEVRKSADSEFAERIQHFAHPIVDLHRTLSLTRLDENSLSRSDFRFGWRHPDRDLYVNSYRSWHQHISSQLKQRNDFSTPPRGRLPFAAPESFQIDRQKSLANARADIAIFLDITDIKQSSILIDNLEYLANHEIVVVAIRDPLKAVGKRVNRSPKIISILSEHSISVQSEADQLSTKTAFVLSPSMLTYGNITHLHSVSNEIFVASWLPDNTFEITDHIGIAERLKEELDKAPTWMAPDVLSQQSWAESG